ncbi:hypothetical protein EAE96_000351 [Botrytis aclada]|nr:hypothetical protein EAE96_000351 [Botrytis aclada]
MTKSNPIDVGQPIQGEQDDNTHGDSSQSMQLEQANSSHGDGSQFTQEKQPDSKEDNDSQPIQGEQANSNHDDSSQYIHVEQSDNKQDDGSQSVEEEQADSKQGDGSQSIQGEQLDSMQGNNSQSIQKKQPGSKQDDGSQSVQEDQPAQQNLPVASGSGIVDFDFSTLRQHPALTIKKTGDNVQLIIDLDFSHSRSPSDIAGLIKALTGYAAVIHDVKILIKARKQHHHVAMCNCRLIYVSTVINFLNDFNLTKVQVIACLDDHDSFEQFGLTIPAYQLNFQNWTLAYKIRGVDGKKWNIPVGSELELRLRHLYRRVFLKKR